MIAAERETTVVASDDSDEVAIWTAQPKVLRRLRKDAAFTETASGFVDGSEWATFTIPADLWSPAGVKRTRRVTAEQRAAAAERMKSVRAQ